MCPISAKAFGGSKSSVDPPCFGGVYSGECEIVLCENAQGGRGKSDVKITFGPEGDETGEKGVWMSIWIEDVDAVYQHCVAQNST
jgi:hypothetical protein